MSINGASRMVQAKNQLENGSYDEMNAQFKNENEVVKNVKKYSSRSAIEHNHSEESLHSRK